MQTRDEFPTLLNSIGLNGIGVELGSFKADFASLIVKEWSGKLFLIDPWRELTDTEYDDASNHKNHTDVYASAINNLSGFEDRAIMIRAKGEQVLDFFKDYSLDFVYIDANHTYESVKEDINMWYPKVKIGGIVAGHDFLPLECYNKENYKKGNKNFPIYMWDNANPDQQFYAGMFGVNPAVEEFCESHEYRFQVTNEFLGTWWFVKK